MIINIKVKPNSSESKVEKNESGGGLVVWVKEKAENNEANIAVIKALSKYYGGAKVKILSGKTSKKKRASIEY